MTLILTRNSREETGIFSTLTKEDGTFIASTLEHSYDGEPKLPNGAYTCVRGQHHLHSGPVETFEITGVPGHTGVLFHVGNTQADSEGCVLLGEHRQGLAVVSSKAAFNNFINLLNGIDSFTINVVG